MGEGQGGWERVGEGREGSGRMGKGQGGWGRVREDGPGRVRESDGGWGGSGGAGYVGRVRVGPCFLPSIRSAWQLLLPT